MPKLLSQNVAVVGDCFAADAIQCLKLMLYMSDLAPAHFFLLPHKMEALAACTLTAKSLKTEWVGVTNTIAKEALAATFRK